MKNTILDMLLASPSSEGTVTFLQKGVEFTLSWNQPKAQKRAVYNDPAPAPAAAEPEFKSMDAALQHLRVRLLEISKQKSLLAACKKMKIPYGLFFSGNQMRAKSWKKFEAIGITVPQCVKAQRELASRETPENDM